MKLICYLSLGYPSLEHSVRIAKEYIKAGCDIIEIDFPTRNCYLESDYIRARMNGALDACADYREYMKTIVRIKEENSEAKFIVLAYEHTIMEIGVKEFLDFSLKNGLRDLIYIGNSHPEVRSLLIAEGIKVSSYIQFHMPEEEIASAQATNGFIYLQSKPGKEINPQFPTLKACIDYLRNGLKLENLIYCGVGISSPEDIRMVKEAGADGAFVGSLVLKLHDDLPKMAETIRLLKAATE